MRVVGDSGGKIEPLLQKTRELPGIVSCLGRSEHRERARCRVPRLRDERKSEDVGRVVDSALKQQLDFANRHLLISQKVIHQEPLLRHDRREPILKGKTGHGYLQKLTLCVVLFLFANRARVKITHHQKHDDGQRRDQKDKNKDATRANRVSEGVVARRFDLQSFHPPVIKRHSTRASLYQKGALIFH